MQPDNMKAPASEADWQSCRIGSCQRHQGCQYMPCRNTAVPRPAFVEAGEVIPDRPAVQAIERQLNWACGDNCHEDERGHEPRCQAARDGLAALSHRLASIEPMREALEKIVEVGTRRTTERIGDMYDPVNGYADHEEISEEAEIARAALSTCEGRDD